MDAILLTSRKLISLLPRPSRVRRALAYFNPLLRVSHKFSGRTETPTISRDLVLSLREREREREGERKTMYKPNDRCAPVGLPVIDKKLRYTLSVEKEDN
jgi:hypothetical protein